MYGSVQLHEYPTPDFSREHKPFSPHTSPPHTVPSQSWIFAPTRPSPAFSSYNLSFTYKFLNSTSYIYIYRVTLKGRDREKILNKSSLKSHFLWVTLYKVVISVCLIVCPIITHEFLDRFVLNSVEPRECSKLD